MFYIQFINASIHFCNDLVKMTYSCCILQIRMDMRVALLLLFMVSMTMAMDLRNLYKYERPEYEVLF